MTVDSKRAIAASRARTARATGRRVALVPIALALMIALPGCKRPDAPATTAPAAPSPQPVAAADAQTGIHPELWPQPKWPFADDPALDKRVDTLLASMSVEEKVGQIVQGDITTITPEDLRKYRLGSILAGGSSDPGGKYNATPAQWLALSDAYWEASMDTRGGGKAIPVIFGIDAVHGQSNIVGATLFPHNIGLGATRDVELMREIGRVTAAETRVTGMEWAFAPTVAVPQDDRWGRSYEGYSESPTVVAPFAAAMVEGMQGRAGAPDFLDDEHVMVSVKHFLGDGGTADGKDQGDTQVAETALRDIHGAGYPPAIAAGAQAVMASYNSFHGEKMHGNRALLTGVLKERMHFGGFVVGDWNGHAQVKGCTKTDCPAAINAGLDMFMAPDSWRGLYDSTVAEAKSGAIPMARLDDAVRRILRVKFRMGLFDKPKPSARKLGGKFALLGAPEHRAIARRAVRESLVLLKNQGGVLPLRPDATLLVAGDGADNMTKQVGGWTLTWQGTGTQRADFPNATTIWEGLQSQVKAAGGHAELAVDGHYKQKPDAAIVVFGEDAYAEFQGDIPTLLLRAGDDADLKLIRKLKADGIPVVAVFLSGRSLWMNREINAADAFVAAWLPGSEGAGIADVLLRDAKGAVQFDFKGKLGYSWPRRGDQYANNVGQANYDPLFPFGYGLTYADKGDLAPLPEDPGVKMGAQANTYFANGVAAQGFRLRLLGADGAATDIAQPQAASKDGHVTMTAIDYKRQEGARRLVWSGDGSVELAATTPMDLDRETNGDVLLVVTLRVDAVPKDGVVLVVGAANGKQATLPITPWLAKLPRGQWLRAGVMLKCLRAAGADVGKLDVPFAIRAGKGLDLSLAEVTAATAVDSKLDCAIE